MLNFINSKLSIFSMIMGFVSLVILVNKGFLDMNDISIMYWLMGLIGSFYIGSWLLFILLIKKLINKIFGKMF